MTSIRRAVSRSVVVSRFINNTKKEDIIRHTRKPIISPSYDVFINHRGIDTKRTIAGLLYDRLTQLNLRPFLDNRTMQPGDKLFETIDSAVSECKIGIAIFSPRYCDSVFCLHELAMLVEKKKKIIPIFCDIRPSELLFPDVKCSSSYTHDEVNRYKLALHEAKYTVGLTFDSRSGNFSELIGRTSDIVAKIIRESKK